MGRFLQWHREASKVLVSRWVYPRSTRSTKRLETGPDLCDKNFRLFPGGEVAALLDLVEVDEFGIRLLCPAARGGIELVREDAHGNRDGDAFGIEVPFAEIFPIETGAGNPGVGQPGDGDVVQYIVARQALGLAVEDAGDQLVTARVVVEEISRQADG